ncbi:MAG: endolytic transglycosylase MltG [Clostridiales Family XIII bacterium]|jgi:cytoskeletal protein RodZ|nr:endolytic transglycosylase MltG [Clostridiales Family XIII bacterium]
MRNFLYNKSDILIALIIIAVAAIIIWTRVDAIMSAGDGEKGSPAATSEESSNTPPAPDTNETQQPITESEAPPDEATPPADDESSPDGEGEVTADEGNPPEDEAPADEDPVEFTVEVGSAASTVAEDLEASGLVESAGAFLDELKAQGAEKKLKAGTFKIKPGTSMADIVKKLTNR